jgi:redox-sensitive bicupin YhaK (pirin superfamily)
MTAGTGISNSEFNRGSEPLKIFQIWFAPNCKGITPRYSMRRFPDIGGSGDLVVLASGLPEAESSTHLPLTAAARVLGASVEEGQRLSYPVPEGHELYVVASRGEIRVNGLRIGEGDGVAAFAESELRFEALADTDLIVAEMA